MGVNDYMVTSIQTLCTSERDSTSYKSHMSQEVLLMLNLRTCDCKKESWKTHHHTPCRHCCSPQEMLGVLMLRAWCEQWPQHKKCWLFWNTLTPPIQDERIAAKLVQLILWQPHRAIDHLVEVCNCHPIFHTKSINAKLGGQYTQLSGVGASTKVPLWNC